MFLLPNELIKSDCRRFRRTLSVSNILFTEFFDYKLKFHGSHFDKRRAHRNPDD